MQNLAPFSCPNLKKKIIIAFGEKFSLTIKKMHGTCRNLFIQLLMSYYCADLNTFTLHHSKIEK